VDSITRVEERMNGPFPLTCKLAHNYPNPFNPKTVISYTIGEIGQSPVQVDLSIYNVSGKKVMTLVSARQPAGSYTVEWDASDFSSGVYLCQLKAGDFSETRKLIYIK